MDVSERAEQPYPTGTRPDRETRRGRAAFGITPNHLTALRLLMIPGLWVLALLGMPFYLGIGLAVAGLTDVLDGILARRYGQATEFGSHFDSVVDHLLNLSVVLWLLLLRPEFFREQLVPLLIWAAFGLTALAVGWAKFGKVGDLHLYSAKAASFLANLFVIYLFLFADYSRTVFYIVLVMCILAAVETIVVYLTRSPVDERIGSILLRGGRSRRA